ncbi:LysR family transcriptional regulator [Bordetella genomosp. 13]|uniref:LysR family transcriptional regulator n=1 Tax=Bordetella genomosp. 13 TaxID=463040 RepID=UPI001642B102|nr:LysR family transcriptional regulator [Bordetella genomosp. 13]
MHLNLHQLDAFVRVASVGRFSYAAEQMHVSQAGLSILVRKLEERLGVQLFERTSRSVTLTAAGKALLPTAQRMLQDAQWMLNSGHQLVDLSLRRITVALPSALAAAVLPDVLSDFHEAQPDVEVSFRECVREELVQRVYTREVDFGLGFEQPDNSELESLPLGHDVISVVHAKDHPLARLARVRWVDIAQYPLIVITPGSGTRILAEEAFVGIKATLRPAYETSNHVTSVMLASRGLGVALVSSTMSSLAASMRVTVRALQAPQVSRPLCVLKRRGTALAEPAKVFIEMFGKAVGRHRAVARAPKPRRTK